MRETVLQRLKSPVVIGAIVVAAFNLVSQITGADYSAVAEHLVAVVTNVGLVFAAINDAKSKKSF